MINLDYDLDNRGYAVEATYTIYNHQHEWKLTSPKAPETEAKLVVRGEEIVSYPNPGHKHYLQKIQCWIWKTAAYEEGRLLKLAVLGEPE